MPLHYEGLGNGEMAARVNRVAGILHLTDVLDRLPGQVSEGEKQRIAVARAIVRDPNCFLFDEPLSRLDVELRHSMRGQIKAVLSNLSKATVIVTHDQLEALTMADRIAIMRDGLIEQVGSPARGLRQAGQRVCRQLHRHAADEPDRGAVQGLQQRQGDGRLRPAGCGSDRQPRRGAAEPPAR